jgi:hypothetical protein
LRSERIKNGEPDMVLFPSVFNLNMLYPFITFSMRLNRENREVCYSIDALLPPNAFLHIFEQDVLIAKMLLFCNNGSLRDPDMIFCPSEMALMLFPLSKLFN